MSESNVVGQMANAVLEHLIPLAVVALGGYVTYQLLPQVKTWIQTHVDMGTLALIDRILQEVVTEAEASRLKHELAGKAFEVLEWAFDEADVRLNALGIDINADRLFKLLRGALVKYLASQGVSLEVPDGPDTLDRDMVPLTGNAYIAVSPQKIKAEAKQALAARLWA